ncbi:MAG: serine protein kinase RIO [Crenarchaeota archaeon]|nr:serine protein kinase RIO [Thermoproteota archaeon]
MSLFWERVEKRRYKIKDIDQLKTVDDVFNQYTLEALYELMNRRIIGDIHGPVAQGKEAKVFWGETPNGEDIAIKIFYTLTAQFIRGRQKYIVYDHRFENVKTSSKFRLMEVWCRKEFRNLKIAYEAGVRVPRPIAFYRNILVMEFISYQGQRGVPAPLLKEYPPDDPEQAYHTILKYIERGFILGKIIHADLSEFNIVNTGTELVIIDWGSAVKVSGPETYEFLLRDIKNITRYFQKEHDIPVYDPEKVFKTILKRAEQFKKEEKIQEKDGYLIIGGKTLIEELEEETQQETETQE